VENFMYLRSKVVTNGNVTEQITKRIKKAWNLYQLVRDMLWKWEIPKGKV
jgi:hypothetical protein